MGLVMQASGSLVDVNIFWNCLEYPWPGDGIVHTSTALGWRRVKEFDLKLTLGMTERR